MKKFLLSLSFVTVAFAGAAQAGECLAINQETGECIRWKHYGKKALRVYNSDPVIALRLGAGAYSCAYGNALGCVGAGTAAITSIGKTPGFDDPQYSGCTPMYIDANGRGVYKWDSHCK